MTLYASIAALTLTMRNDATQTGLEMKLTDMMTLEYGKNSAINDVSGLHVLTVLKMSRSSTHYKPIMPAAASNPISIGAKPSGTKVATR